MKPLRILLWTCAALAVAAPLRAADDPLRSSSIIDDDFAALKASADASKKKAKEIPQVQAAPPPGAAQTPPALALNCSYSKKDDFYSLELGSFIDKTLFAPSDKGGLAVTTTAPVDGKLLKLSATMPDASGQLKAVLTWGGGSKTASFEPKGKKLNGYRFTVALKTPESACIVVGCGINVEPASLAGKSCQ